jgi:hypothetical protein
MGWLYFNILPGGKERPWEWAGWMARNLGMAGTASGGVLLEGQVERAVVEKSSFVVADEDANTSEEALLPSSFEYFTDGSIDE